jgi:type I restriction enzyme S subunit
LSVSDWQNTSWGALATLEYGKAIRGYQDALGDYRVYGTNGPIGWCDEALYDSPSVVVGRKGAYRGIHYAAKPFYVIDTAFYLKPKTHFDMRWAYYQLLTQDINAMDSGSAIPSTSRDEFYRLPVKVPSLGEQREIAGLLGSLDEAININQQMNQTLLECARTMFTDWFIEFAPVRAKSQANSPYLAPQLWELFPNSLDAQDKPSGWETLSLGDVSKKITKGTTPTRPEINNAELGQPQITFLRVNAISDNGSILWDKLEYIPESIHSGSLKRSIIASGDVLYTIAGTIGRVTMASDDLLPANANQAVAIIRPDSARVPSRFLYLFLTTKSIQQELHTNVVHAVQANLSLSMISRALITLPPADRLVALFEPINELFEKAANNAKQIRTLAELRNLLLPDLISGKVRLRTAQEIVEDAL